MELGETAWIHRSEDFCIGENTIKSDENLGENSYHTHTDKELLHLTF